jgi:protein-S-isoprenylcysteine O-methyltransferase Ste14
MRRAVRAAIGTLLFLVVAPGTVAGLVPWLLSGWRMSEPFLGFGGLRWIGGALIVAGIPPLLDSFRRFAQEGLGTPAPLYPTNRLIVTGLYRHVRNPMYVAVAAVILGQALLLANIPLLVWGAIVCLGFDLFVRLYEEPTLRRRYGVQFATYCASVPRWLPRLTPWHDAGSFAQGE